MGEPLRARGGFNLWGLHTVWETNAFPFGFSTSGKGFSKLKVAERALSISEQIIPSRPVLGLFPGGHPQSAWDTNFFSFFA